jgi:sodium transport system permease protein
MNMNGLRVVFKKELKDLFRDKKTIFVGILLPLLIFPIMFGIIGKSIDSTNKKVEENLKIAISDSGQSSLGMDIIESKDIKKDVQDGKLYIGLIIPKDFEEKINAEKKSDLTLVLDDTSQTSELALGKVNGYIEEYSKLVVKNRLISKKIDVSILNPINIKQETAAKEKGGVGKQILSMLLPMILIIYALSSAMPAAIDLGAGEKERGTLEPLLTTQISRMNLLFGKLFAITLMGLIGTLASMAGIGLSLKVSPNLFGGNMSTVLPIKAICLIALCSLFVTMIFGAIELTVSIYARSFKEAQTYLTPLMIVGMVAVYGTMAIDIKDVSTLLFNIPITNIALTMKEFISGIYNPIHMTITLSWSIIYIVASVLFARYMFTREEVIFRT